MIAIPRPRAALDAKRSPSQNKLPAPASAGTAAPSTAFGSAQERLQDLPPAVAAALRLAGSQRQWRKGQVVLCQGQRSGALVVALQGRLAATLAQAGGQHTLLRWLEAGELVALADVLADLPSPASIVAQGVASTLHIPRAAFINVLQQQPDGAIGVAVLLARRLGELFRYVEMTASRPLPDRVRFALQRLARSQAQGDGAGGLRLRLTQAELAAAAGASRQRVHLALQQLQASGHLALGYGVVTLLPAGQWQVQSPG